MFSVKSGVLGPQNRQKSAIFGDLGTYLGFGTGGGSQKGFNRSRLPPNNCAFRESTLPPLPTQICVQNSCFRLIEEMGGHGNLGVFLGFRGLGAGSMVY